MKQKTVAVLGLGLFGTSIARTIAKRNSEVIAMDRDMESVEKIAADVLHAVQGDFTNIEHLISADIESCDVAIIASGERLEDSIMGILNLKKLNVSHIIVKTKNREYREVLLKVGADRVVLPEVEMGIRLGNELSKTSIMDLLKIDDKYHVVEIHAMEEWYGKTIADLNLRKDYGFNIIAIKTHDSPEFSIVINPEYIVCEHDLLIVLSENHAINNEGLMNDKT